MHWWYLATGIVVSLAVFSLILFGLIRWISRFEPYGTFLRLRTRQKLAFFRILLRDRDKQVPLYVKSIPVLLILYLSIPFDIIPDFVPVLGYLDDVAIALLALVLVIKLTPRHVVLEMLHRAQEDASPRKDPGSS